MKKIIPLLFLGFLGRMQAQSNVWEYIDAINDSIANIPCIFEGIVQEVEIYAGDSRGNKIPFSQAYWDGEIGIPYSDDGEKAYGFTLARIFVCKQYKGDLEQGEYYLVRSKAQSIDDVVFWAHEDGDTTIEYIYVEPPRGGTADRLLLPHESWPQKKLFFASKADPIDEAEYENRSDWSNFTSKFEVDFNVPVDIPNGDGSYTRKTAYAAFVPHAFFTYDSLEMFLNLIETIDPAPEDFCLLARTTSVPSNEIQPELTIFPNPSSTFEPLTIRVNKPSVITVYDLLGHTIISSQGMELTLPQGLPSGVYLAEIITGDKRNSAKIMKQ